MNANDFAKGQKAPPPAVPAEEQRVDLDPTRPLGALESLLAGEFLRPGMTLHIPYLGYRIPLTEANIDKFKADIRWLVHVHGGAALFRHLGVLAPASAATTLLMLQSIQLILKSYDPRYA